MKYQITKENLGKLIQDIRTSKWPAKIKIDETDTVLMVSISKFGTSTLFFDISNPGNDLLVVELGKSDVSFFHKGYIKDVTTALDTMFLENHGVAV